MPSYQDIDTRLAVLEDKLSWFFSNMRQKSIVPTGTVNAAGEPQGRVVVQNLHDAYREFNNENLATVAASVARGRSNERVGSRPSVETVSAPAPTAVGSFEPPDDDGRVAGGVGPFGPVETFQELRDRLRREGIGR